MLKPGDHIVLLIPENPRLNGAVGTVSRVTSWGAFVDTPSAATGVYRADFSEMIKVNETNGVHKPDATGDICDHCGSANMVRTGTCKTCGDCGESGGCA